MIRSCSRIALAVAASLALLATTPAFSAQRTFVSAAPGVVDNPACSLVAPCRQFSAALLATSPGGEIIVLDSAGYGTVTIGQSVSIIAPPGVYAGISVFGGDGVGVFTISSDKVVLRGLSINGQGGGGNSGIHVLGSGTVYIERCTVANIGGIGIQIDGGRIHIRDTLVQGSTLSGLHLIGGTSPFVSVIDSQFVANGTRGIQVDSFVAEWFWDG